MKKKSKNGFTLVELLATITILAIIIGLSIASYSRVKDKIIQKDYENLITYIEIKAIEYANATGITNNVSVERLIEEGYLQPDDQTDIYDPRSNKSLNCHIINFVYENGEYVATFEDEGNC